MPSEGRKPAAFAPEEAPDAVRDALFGAGAGRIGGYERGSWHAAGTGTLVGGECSDPVLPERGREERLAELGLETVYPVECRADIVRAPRAAHPYEKLAYDPARLVALPA